MRSLIGAALLAAMQIACGGDTGSDSSNSGGKGGTAGKDGGAGNGGSSASGGSGGTSTGGSGGTVATGGVAGSGGSAGSGGAAGGGGAAGSGGAAGGTGKACGGIAGTPCDTGEWCDFVGGTCGGGDQLGECKLKPSGGCPQSCNVVCGCDNKAYCNACLANVWGTDTTDNTSCVKGNGTQGDPCAKDGDCQSAFKCCPSCGALGCPLACIMTQGGQCPAFP